jgi:hypothetical protein
MKTTVWASALFFAVLATFMVAAPGCGSSSSTTLSDLNISPISPVITFPGGTEQFSATAVYSNNTNATVTASCAWSSSNTNVAAINSGGSTPGLATATGTGSTTITCSYSSNNSSIQSSTDLTVNPVSISTASATGKAEVSFEAASGVPVASVKIDGRVYPGDQLPSELPAGRHYFASSDGRYTFVMNLYGQRAYTFNISSDGRVQLTEARSAN